MLYPFNDNLNPSSKSSKLVCSLSDVSSLAYAVRNDVINLSCFSGIAKYPSETTD